MDNQKITENFWWEEVICPCCDRVKIIPAFWKHIDALQRMRTTLGFPIIINSGYRCERHNAEVNGGARSMHLLIATDIRPEEPNGAMTHAEKQSLVAGRLQEMYDIAPSLGFTGRGSYETFIHLDMRAEKLDWRG